jgi:hypothetical protein
MEIQEIDLRKEIENLSDSDLNVWIRFFRAFADQHKADQTSDARFLFAIFNSLWAEAIRRQKVWNRITDSLGNIDFSDTV